MAQGRITQWDDERGYGFIAPDDGGPTVFLHVSALLKGSRRPSAGDEVRYGTRTDERGRLQAINGELAAVPAAPPAPRVIPPRKPPQRWSVIEQLAVGSFASLLLFGVVARDLSVIVPIVVGLICIGTFAAYGDDKARAEQGRWRTPESSLLLLCLFGGWPGAIAAMRWWRHKTSKASFIGAFWVTVLVNLIVAAIIALPEVRQLLILALEQPSP